LIKKPFGSPRDDLLKQAAEDALRNWRTWEDDFSLRVSSGDDAFKSLPVFQSLPRFYGFGFDYSVFRLYDRNKLDDLRLYLSGLEDPISHALLHERLRAWAVTYELSLKKENNSGELVAIQKNHISLVSKLLGLWKPAEYPMWDTFAREGMKCVVRPKPASRYEGPKVENYENFRKDFEIIASEWSDDIRRVAEPKDFRGCLGCSTYRTLDNYLMLVGREKKAEETSQSKKNR
jgi:hypothetical protein